MGRVEGEISFKNSHEVEWRIPNYLSLKDSEIFSPKFCIAGKDWYLQLVPSPSVDSEDKGEESSGWISLFLWRADFLQASLIFSFGVKKADGTVEHIRRSTLRCDPFLNGFIQFLKMSDLQQPNMLASGTLTLNCTLMTWKDFESCGSLDSLSRNFANLLTSKRGSDATIKVMGEEFPVHKLVLCARSPVFAAAFETDMKEKATGILEIEDFDPSVFSEFLMYLYCGKIESGPQNPRELYKLADKYDVEDLKTYSLIIIMSSLTVDNVLDAVVFGNQFDEEDLIFEIQKFFNENYKDIISTTKWDAFIAKNTAVANKLLKDMANDYSK